MAGVIDVTGVEPVPAPAVPLPEVGTGELVVIAGGTTTVVSVVVGRAELAGLDGDGAVPESEFCVP